MVNENSKDKESTRFYKEALELLTETGVLFMLGGAFALFHYTGLYRDTKDLDIFLKASDYPRVLQFFSEKGFTVELHDARWIAKVFKGDYFIDLIFDSVNNICTVDDTWLAHAPENEAWGVKVKLLPAEELIWCKSYVCNRERFDGADINHVLLRYGKKLNWERLLCRLDRHWHLLLSHLIFFQFVYPSEYRDIIPRWLFDELISRANQQYNLPAPLQRVCRGPMIDNTQYSVDVKEWDYLAYTIKTV